MNRKRRFRWLDRPRRLFEFLLRTNPSGDASEEAVALAKAGREPVALLCVPIGSIILVIINSFLISSAKRDVFEYRIDLPGVPKGTPLGEVFVNNRAWADKSLEESGWLDEVCGDRNTPAIERIEVVIASIVDRAPGDYRERCREAFSPIARNVGMIYVETRRPNVDEVMEMIAREDRKTRTALLSAPKEDTPTKIEFLRLLIGDLNRQVEASTHRVDRLNGVFQLLIYIVFLTAVGQIGLRAIRVNWAIGRMRNLATRQGHSHAGPFYTRLASEHFYRPLSVLTGVIPSLGFLGTVFGMGRALALSGGLSIDSERIDTIDKMSEMLGLAFNTTLVALALAIVLSLGTRGLRSFEMRRIQVELGELSPDH